MAKKTKKEEAVVTNDATGFVLTDELRKMAEKKPVFDIVCVSDRNSVLYPFRVSAIWNEFTEIYKGLADISCVTVSSEAFAKMPTEEIVKHNTIVFDNCCDFYCLKKATETREAVLNGIDPEWKEKISAAGKDAKKVADELDKKKSRAMRMIYFLDEFVWEAPVGRVRDVQSVQVVEGLLNVSDEMVVPTAELREALTHFGFVGEDRSIAVVPSGVSCSMYPLFRNFAKVGTATKQLAEKPKVLVKGLEIPDNVQEFIMNNYKKMDITVCSVGMLNEHLMGLLQTRKIKHIYHWANPTINKVNLITTYAIERDIGFDFVITTKPAALTGKMYELCLGEEDIVQAVAYGALPICGVDDLEPDAEHVSKAAGLTFGASTTAKEIRKMIEDNIVAVRWNESYNKYRSRIEMLNLSSPQLLSMYFGVFLGKELSLARNALAKELKAQQEANVGEKADNIIKFNPKLSN